MDAWTHWVLWGLESYQQPMVWSHILNIATMWYTLDMSLNDMGSYSCLYITWVAALLGGFLLRMSGFTSASKNIRVTNSGRSLSTCKVQGSLQQALLSGHWNFRASVGTLARNPKSPEGLG